MPGATLLKRLPGDLYRLFFPPVCAACGEATSAETGFMCPACRLDMPMTHYWESPENPVKDKFAGLLPLRNASAFIYYVHGSRFRSLIHSFKYAGRWKTARDMGLWYGHCLRESGLYTDIDIVVPVPLHRRKLLRRGYNQAEYICRGIAEALGAEVCTGNLIRRRHGKSQTTVEGGQRWENVRDAFLVKHPSELSGKHLLLVDDVLTTGATLTACGQSILDAAPDAQLSIAALAATRT